MPSNQRLKSKDMALEKYREASKWRDALENAMNSWRVWSIYHVTLDYLLKRADYRGVDYHMRIRRELDRSHDMMISARENVRTMARCASACEMTARVYMEKYEEREWMSSMHQDSDVE